MIRTQVLLKLIKPYLRIRIQFIAEQLNISMAQVESLLVALILDGHVDGRIDQLEQLLLLNKDTKDAVRYQSLGKWASQLQSLHTAVFNKLS